MCSCRRLGATASHPTRRTEGRAIARALRCQRLRIISTLLKFAGKVNGELERLVRYPARDSNPHGLSAQRFAGLGVDQFRCDARGSVRMLAGEKVLRHQEGTTDPIAAWRTAPGRCILDEPRGNLLSTGGPMLHRALHRHTTLVAVVIASAFPLCVAAAQTPAPASTTFVQLALKGIATPAPNVELVQSIIDYAPRAKDPSNALQAPRMFIVVEGKLTVRIGDATEHYAVGKGALIPSGSTVSLVNESTTARARVFVSTLLPVGGGAPAREPDGTIFAGRPTTAITSRIPIYGVPAVVDLTQMGYRFDAGFTTPSHVMIQPHLQTITEGECVYSYFDGHTESFRPGEQAQMYVGRPGTMGTKGPVKCAFLMTWVRTPGKPNTVPAPRPRP